MNDISKFSLDDELKMAEISKIRLEIKNASYSFWLDILKLLGGLILGSLSALIAYTQYVDAKVAKLEAKDAQQSEKDVVEKLKETKTEQEEYKQSLALQAAEPKIAAATLVYIQFQGGTTREFINSLRGELQKNSFNAPGAERISKKYKSAIKYFVTSAGDGDKEEAMRLAKLVEGFYRRKGCALTISVTPVPATKKTPIEVWLSEKDVCNG